MLTERDIQGHWQRIWLRAPGFEDGTTRVHWMQSGNLYADVRIPLENPDLGDATCLADLDAQSLAMLAEAEGFAGTTVVQDGVCTWAREINWHGATEDVDAGRLSFDGDGDLIEEGVHADYAELWTRPHAVPSEGVRLTCGGKTAFLVTVGNRFVFGIGDPVAPASASTLCGLERGRVDRAALSGLFDRVHVFGTWRGPFGCAILATNPFLNGKACLRRTDMGFVYSHVGFEGDVEEIPLERVQPYAWSAQSMSAE